MKIPSSQLIRKTEITFPRLQIFDATSAMKAGVGSPLRYPIVSISGSLQVLSNHGSSGP